MKTAVRLLLFTLLLCPLTDAQAQMSLGVRRGDYIFGINGGFAYQLSDIRSAANGGGFGLTLGRTVVGGAYSPVSVDLRGRLLYARTFGQDPFRSFQIENNKALNGAGGLDYINYPQEFNEPRGFVFQNHRTTIGELGLEAVFTLEEIRRRTGIVTSLFGGIGLNGFHAKVDQADAFGNEYYAAYSGLRDNRPVSAVLRDLRGSILDGTYETNADGFDDLPKFRFMPSVGLELGFHLTPALSLHAGHRVTFSGTDLLDGQQWASRDKDIYHYTSFGIQYRFRPPERPAELPPVIDIVEPVSRTHYSRNFNGFVRARISNVRSAADVSCTVNGRDTPFRFSGDQFTLDFPLRPGRNDVQITARNRAGRAQGDVVIILEDAVMPPPPPPVGYPPRISVTNPPGRSATVAEPRFSLRAGVTEVADRNAIEVLVDGARSNFSFDNRSGNLSADLNLREGINRIRITARNNFGTDAADVEIAYEPRRFPPTVRIVEPADRSQVQVSSVNLRAEVRYMELKENIYLYLNGREIRNFDFDTRQETIRAGLTLEEGANTIEVVARNRSGEARDAVTVTYRRPVQTRPPTVTITQPSTTNSTTNAATALIEATTRNVDRRDDVSFFVNGSRSDNFSFNSSTGRFSATVNLLTGNNDIAIRVANADGSDQAAVSIRRTEGEVELPRPPRVRITRPANQFISDRNTVDVRASVENVSERNAISLLVNGKRFSNFNFNPGSREMTATVTLAEGNNIIRVEASNPDGTASDEVNVQYRRLVPPVVTITAPENNSTASEAAATLRARIQNATDRNQISVTLNGNAVSNFSFNTSNGELSANLTLAEGSNAIRVHAATPGGSDEKTVNVQYRRLVPPVVTITAPENNSTASEAAATLRARIQNATDRNQISVTLNGNAVSNFSFNTSNGELSANLTLAEGSNAIRVRAATPGGSDEKTVNVQYRRLVPPVVTITAPENNSTASEAAATLRARIQNATDRNQLSVTLNGSAVSNFSFNTSNGELSANLTLAEGSNAIRVRAATPGGSDEKTVNVQYRRLVPPVVTITAPENNSTASEAAATLRARIQNVTDRNQISVTLNGSAVSNFSFNTSNGELSANLTLAEGSNAIRVRAATPGGSDEKTVNVQYRKPMPPTVLITSPANNTVLETNTVEVRAVVTNAGGSRSVTFTINGDAKAQFNLQGSDFSATVENLKEGENTLSISARNSDGTAEASVKVTYRPKPADPKPVVRFITPSRPGTTAKGPEVQIKASVLHVSAKGEIQLERNGKPIGEFAFNLKARELTATLPLEPGTNTIRIIATNAAGSDTASTTVLNPELIELNPPVVTIESVSQPTLNPMNPTQGRSTVVAKIQGIESSSQITFTVNGAPVRDFTYNGKSGAFQSTVTLVRGTNTITIRAENKDGADEKTRTLEF